MKKAPGNSFVIQKHRATRLHYDFRLEMEGVLRSWAIPKGPSFNPAEKRLAVLTEDHPMDYGGFEGVIPKGNYGAGKVIIWDNGTYEMVDPETPEKGWAKGKLHFVLKGKKLNGEWVLVRGSRDPKQWIFFKVRDKYATTEGDVIVDTARVHHFGKSCRRSRRARLKKNFRKHTGTGSLRSKANLNALA